MVPIRQLFAKLYQFENRPHYNTSGTRRSSMVVGGIRYHQIHDAFHIVPDCRRLHKLASPQIWCWLADWISSYGQKPLGVPSRKAPWCVGVVCCQKSVDVEVPERAITSKLGKLTSAIVVSQNVAHRTTKLWWYRPLQTTVPMGCRQSDHEVRRLKTIPSGVFFSKRFHAEFFGARDSDFPKNFTDGGSTISIVGYNRLQ